MTISQVKYSIPLIVKQAEWWNDSEEPIYLNPTPRVAQRTAIDFNTENLVQYSDLPYLKKLTAEAQGVSVIVTAEIDGDATPDRIIAVRDEISGQCSDGWGEGFEQREFKGAELGYSVRGVYISTWASGRGAEVLSG